MRCVVFCLKTASQERVLTIHERLLIAPSKNNIQPEYIKQFQCLGGKYASHQHQDSSTFLQILKQTGNVSLETLETKVLRFLLTGKGPWNSSPGKEHVSPSMKSEACQLYGFSPMSLFSPTTRIHSNSHRKIFSPLEEQRHQRGVNFEREISERRQINSFACNRD